MRLGRPSGTMMGHLDYRADNQGSRTNFILLCIKLPEEDDIRRAMPETCAGQSKGRLIVATLQIRHFN